jgi:mono/diheme cytochrome c family protein
MKPSNLRATVWATLAIACGIWMASVLAAEDSAPVLSRRDLAMASGEVIYQHVCQGCHMADGRGAQGGGNYPALAGNEHLASAEFTAATVFLGRRNMPHFGMQAGLGPFESFVVLHLDDAEIAAVVNYVRSHFGNHYTDELTAADIAALHPGAQSKP